MKAFLFILIAALPVSVSTLGAQAPDHQSFSTQLKKYVDADGLVDYKAWQENQDELESYLDELSESIPTGSWSREDQLAYWINAYNAFTIKLILDHYPLQSIKDLHKGNPWEVKWIELGGETYSLNQIENEIIRPTFKDARIHFAVNCAAASCPPLLNEAYVPEKLEAQLDEQARAFINNPRYNGLSIAGVFVSRIFDWYQEDFGNLVSYLNRYNKGEKIPRSAMVAFKEYDWTLNGKDSVSPSSRGGN